MIEVLRLIDDIDRTILQLLQENARIANAEIARRLEMAPSAVLERIRKLETRGILSGYEARVAPAALGLGLMAFVFVRAEGQVGSTAVGQRLAAIPEVQEVHHITGEDCYLVKLRVADPEALGELLRTKFGTIPEIRSTRTTIVLSTLKETGRLHIAAGPRAPDLPAPSGEAAAPVPAEETDD